MKKPRFNEREVPTVYRHILSADWFRKFSLWDRIRILFGFNLIVCVRITTVNSPGRFQPIIAAEVTKETTASNYLTEQMKNVLVEKGKTP